MLQALNVFRPPGSVNPNEAESAIDALVSATSSFSDEARAAAELEDTIAAARAGRKSPAG